MKPCHIRFAIVFTIALTELGIKAVASVAGQSSAVSIGAQNLWKDQDESSQEKHDVDCEDVLASRAVTVGINSYAIKIPCLQSDKIDVGGYCPGPGVVQIGTSRITLAAGETSTLDTKSICGNSASCAGYGLVKIGTTTITIADGSTTSIASQQICGTSACPDSAFLAIGTATITIAAGSTSTLNPTAVCGACPPGIVEIDGTSITIPAGGNIDVGSFCPTPPAFGLFAIGTRTFTVQAGGTAGVAADEICGTCSVGAVQINSNTVTVTPCSTIDVGSFCPTYPIDGTIQIGTAAFTVPAGGTTAVAADEICGTCSVGAVQINSNTVTVTPCSTIDVGSFCPTYPIDGTIKIGTSTITVPAGSLVATDCTDVCGTCPPATAVVSLRSTVIPAGGIADLDGYCAQTAIVDIGGVILQPPCGRLTSVDPSSVCPSCSGAIVTIGPTVTSLPPGDNVNLGGLCPSATLAIGSQAFTLSAGAVSSINPTAVCPTPPPESANVVVGSGPTAITTSFNCGTGTHSINPLPLPNCSGSFFGACVPVLLYALDPQSLISASYLNMFDVRTRILSSSCIPQGGYAYNGILATGFAGYLYNEADMPDASSNCASGGVDFSMQCRNIVSGAPGTIFPCPA